MPSILHVMHETWYQTANRYGWSYGWLRQRSDRLDRELFC